MQSQDLMDLTMACFSFPQAPDPNIVRENIMLTVEGVFRNGINNVTIEGPDGIGKTTVLAQFAQKHPQTALSLFLDASSPRSYDVYTAQLDLCNQLEFLIHGREIEDQDLRRVDNAYLGVLLTELQRRSRRRKESFYFVIDGLEDIPQEHAHLAENIRSLLPIGVQGFYFLFSRTGSQQVSGPLSKHRQQPFPLPPFTLGETESYFSDLAIERGSIREIHDTSGGLPGSLASARRTLTAGKDIQAFLDNMPAEMYDLFRIEWREMEGADDLTLNLLALITFAKRDYTFTELARILDVEPDLPADRLGRLGFITHQDGRVAFVTGVTPVWWTAKDYATRSMIVPLLS